MEANARYVHLTDQIFSWVERANSQAVTSTITMTELLVQPYRESNLQLVDQFYALLSTYPNLRWVAPDLKIADTAARDRALYRLRTPDAIQAATAECFGATGLFTNDPVFERVPTLETLVLDRLLD